MAKTKRTRRTHRDHDALRHDLTILLTKGFSWQACCDKVGVSVGTGYNLRKEDPNFDAEVRRLLASPLHQQRIAASKAETEAGQYEDWRRQFIVQYRLTGDFVSAANAVSREVLEIEAMLDPSSDTYDEELASQYNEQEACRVREVEDNVFRQALKGNSLVAQKFLLEKLNTKYGKVGPTDSKTLNLFWFSSEQEQNALSLLNRLFDPHEPTNDFSRLLTAG